jgi:tetratricopeptide (TPR) repeat protein
MTKEELFAVMEQIAEEREAARPIVRELAESGRQIDDIEIPEGWRTAGMVVELCEFAYGHLETDPLKCLSFSLLSVAIAAGVHVSRYPNPISSCLAGHSWRHLGWSHRYSNKYDAAHRAFDAARSFFSSAPPLTYELGLLLYAKASILLLELRTTDACDSIAAARQIFSEFGDLRRQNHCDILLGLGRWTVGDLDGAREFFEKALQSTASLDDPYTIGSICNGLGRIYHRLGKTADAVLTLERGREIFAGLDMPSEVTRVNWGIAQVLLGTGDAERALLLLEPIRADFLSRHMPEEAGEVGLHIVDALVATGQLETAKRLATQVLNEFVDAQLNVYAIQALGYLRDLLETTGDPKRVVRHVSSYVEKLDNEPELIFLPIPDRV